MTSRLETQLTTAISDYNPQRNPSIRALAKTYNISRRTLARRLNGGHSHTIGHASQQLLSIEQEQQLERWILNLEAEGHAPTHKTVREIAGCISKFSGGPETVGNNWIS